MDLSQRSDTVNVTINMAPVSLCFSFSTTSITVKWGVKPCLIEAYLFFHKYNKYLPSSFSQRSDKQRADQTRTFSSKFTRQIEWIEFFKSLLAERAQLGEKNDW